MLPASREAWAKEQAEILIAGLAGSGYDLIGDLDELRPRPPGEPGAAGPPPSRRTRCWTPRWTRPRRWWSTSTARRTRRPGRSRRAARGGLVGRVEATVASSPRLKRTVRELSSRFPAVRRLRILAWRAMERSRARRHS